MLMMHGYTRQEKQERDNRSLGWGSLVEEFNPSHFISLSAPDDLFLPHGYIDQLVDDVARKKFGKTNSLAPVIDRTGIFREVIKRYFLMLSRATSQHIRLLYEIEMSETRVVKSPHIHGFVKYEASPQLIAKHASEKHTKLCEGAYSGKHEDKAKELTIEYQVGSMRNYVPHFRSTDALNALWCDFLKDGYSVSAKSQPDAFQSWSPSKNGAGYTFVKHDFGSQDGSSGDILLDVCPRKQHKCNKKGRKCTFSWSEIN